MSDVNANISINFDTGQALASLRQLQAGLSRFNQSLTQGNVAAANAQKGLNDQLMQAINATGKFVATQKNIATSTSSFTSALEKNQLSMREYFRYTAAAATANTKVFKNMFAQEREIINRARKDRVKSLQAQYIQLSDASGNFVKTLQVVPKHLQMVNGQYADYATRMQMAAQRQQFLNQLLKQGSTQLLNFGKNTQWAGRQLMVGLTIPLTLLGSTAAKIFMEMEKATVRFSRVYGDMTTSGDATNKAIADIQRLGKEFTKYGVAVKDTMEMAASAAAMGLTGNALNAQVIAATRLGVLGQVEQQQALETTISLTNAFGIATQDLANKINFLNAVENQTVLSIEDLTIAIPKAGPVVKQLGGSVEDLAFFMTAMKEGGINASEGANALKSGLASMINPSKKASEFLAGLGVNIKGIVEANKGNLKGTIVGFAQALDTLDPLNRARAIEQLFGKFQFARLSTLFQNVTKDGSQASRALALAGASVEELAILSERELGKVEDATGVKFKKSIEDLKNQLIPIGKAFLQAATPIVEFVGKLLTKFNTLSDGTKKTVAIIVGVVGGLAPVVLMTFGVVMNALANGIKLFAKLREGVAKLNGSNNVLGGGFDYLTQEQIENVAQTNALHTSHSQLISTFNIEKSSVDALAAAYGNAASQARTLAASSPGLFNAVPGPAGAVSGLPKNPLGFAQGGVVPGRGDKDTVPAMLTPGEVVLTKDTVKNNPELVAALQNNSFKKYHDGTGGGSEDIAASLRERFAVSSAPGSDGFEGRMKTLIDGAMSQTKKGVERVIRFAAASGVEITAEQTDQVEFYRKKMLKAIEDAGTALVDAIDLSADQIKNRLKEMSPIEGTQARKGFNTFDLIDKHGNQPQSETFGHLTPGTRMSGSQTKERLEPGSKVATEVDAIERAATYLNNLPKSDPRKPKKPIVPEYNVVSGLGIDGMSQDTNTLLKLGTKNTQEFLNELNNVGPLEAWDTLMKQNGLTVEENGREIEILHAKFKAFVADLATKKKEISDADVTGFLTGLENDPEISPRMKNAVKRSENKITAARLSGVSSEDGANIEDVVRSGEVKVPGLVDRTKFKIAKSGSAQGGESVSNRVNGIGFYDAEVEEQLAAEAETLRPPKVKATPEAEADAELEGEKIGKAAIRGVKKGAKTESPSTDGIEVGKDIAEGVVIGLQQGTPGVVSQSEQLGNAAVPKEVINEKMDVGNKAFYDDLNNPEDYEERQILKSEDRQRRKLGKTRARVGKTDIDNKQFYDDIDTPEFREQRQILKSQDRHRRKLAAVGQVGAATPTDVPSQTAQLTVASSKKVTTATEKLAVKTEEAATAQAQIVQQIKDESRSRVTIKGNTVNIGKAREMADKAENEAAITKARAHALEAEQAKQKKSNSPTTITDEQVLAAKEKANAAELEYAQIRQELAEQGIGAAQPAKIEKDQELISSGTQEQGDLLRKTVDGADDVADSTVLVADKTDELANITGEAVDAQMANTTNLLTGTELTNATTQNLGEVLQATDQTGLAQGDLAESSENIARLSEDIEEKKKKENELAKKRLARLMAEESGNGVIPEGTQSASKYINPEEAMGAEEAYDYAMGRDADPNDPTDKGETGFTKDKKGRILIDPETGNPTHLTKKELTQKKRGMRKEKVGKISGKAAGALGTATMVAGMAGAPPQVTAALGAAATVAQFAPALAGMGPIGWAVAGIAAVGASAYLVNKHFEGMAKAQAEYVRNTTASSEKLKAIGELNGVVGANEKMNKRRENGQLQGYNEVERKGTDYGVKYLENSTGKLMLDSLKTSINKSGAKEAAEEVALQLAAQVSDGVLTAEQAKSVAYQIGLNLKDSTMTMNINGNLRALIGPNGEDLVNDPFTARMRLVAVSENRTKAAKANIKKAQKENIGWSWLGLKKSGSAEAAQVGALSRAQVEMALLQADSMAEYVEKQKETLEAQREITKDKAKQLEIDQKLANLDSYAARANARVAVSVDNAVDQTDGIITGQSGVTNASGLLGVLSGKNPLDALTGGYGMSAQGIGMALLQTATPLTGGILGSLFNKNGRVEDAYFDANKDDVKAKYKGTAQEASAQRVLDLGAKADEDASFKGDTVAGRKFEAKLQILMSSGVMDPDSLENLLRIFGGDYKKLNTMLTVGIKMHGGAKMAELTGLLSSTNDATAKKIVVRMVRKDPKEFDKIARMLALIKASDGLEVSMDLMLTNMTQTELDALANKLDVIDKMKGPITQEVVVQYGKEHNVDMDGVIDNWDYYGEMKPEVRKEAIQTYTMLKEFLMSFDTPEAKRQWAIETARAEAEMAGEEGSAAYERTYTTTFNMIMKDDTGAAATGLVKSKYGIDPNIAVQTAGDLDGGDKKERDTTYDDLLKRLRNVRNAAIDAAKGVKELNLALLASGSKAVQNRFKGLSQQLRAKGVNEEFIEYLKGLDTKDLKKFAFTATKSGTQKYTEKVGKRNKDGSIAKDKNGKVIMVNKEQKYKAGDVVLTDLGNQMKRGYDKAIMGEFQEAQEVTLRNFNDQEKVQRKLVAAGYDQATIQRILSDEMAVQIIAAEKLTKEELAINAAIAKQTAIREKVNGLINAGKDALTQAANIKMAPKVQEFFTKMKGQGINLSAGALKDLLTNPEQLDGALAAMKDYESGAAGARDRLQEIVNGLNAIKENSNIQIAIEYVQKNTAGRVQAGYEAAQKVMAARTLAYSNMTPGELRKVQVKNQRTGVTTNAGEIGYQNAVKDKFAGVEDPTIAGKSLAGVQKERAALAQRSAVAAAAANVSQQMLSSAQDALSKLQEGLSKTLDGINKKYDEIIKGQQKSIETLNKRLNDEFDKKIKAKQERTSMLSNDLTIMDKQAESINEKYDKQITALQEIQRVQEAITAQQEQQLGLADALTQGDLSAAAAAAQQIRAGNAAQYGGGQLEALDLSRNNEIDSLKGAESGLTRKQIAEEQYQIQQDIYKLETDPVRKKILEDIEKLTEAIAKNEELRTKELEDAEKSIKAQIDAQQLVVDAAQAASDIHSKITADLALQDAELARQEVNLQAIVDSVTEVDDFTGMTLEDWKTLAEKTLDVDELMASIALAMEASANESAAMANSWQDILDIINALPDSVTTKQIIETINYVKTVNLGSDQDPSRYQQPDSTEEDEKNLAELEAAAQELDAAEAAMIAAQNAWDDAVDQGKSSLFQGLHIALTNSKNRFSAAQEKYNAIVAKQNTGSGGSGGGGGGGGRGAMQLLASGGIVNPMKFALGGFASGSDTVPAMLTPGEFVMSKYAVQSYGLDKMKAINNGSPVGGDSVYNYSVSVAVQSDANPDEIARAVMRQIRQVDSQRITGNRN